MKRYWNAVLLSVLLSVLIVLSIGFVFPAFGQSTRLANRLEMSRTLTVNGQGFVDIPQTVAQVQLGVETQQETAVLAQTDIAKRSTAVVQLLQKNNQVKKLSSVGVQLNPVYTQQDDQQTVTGYRGSNLVRFQIDPAAIGKLLDESVAAGASRIDKVSLVASDEAIAVAEAEAIAQATQQAQHQAKAALGVLNHKQQEVIHVQINGAETNPQTLISQNLLTPQATKTIPVVAGEQRVSAVVTLQIRY